MQRSLFNYALKIKATNSKLEKISLLREWHKECKEGFELFWKLMLDDSISFGINKQTFNKNGEYYTDLDEEDIYDVLEYLKENNTSSNEDKEKVRSFINALIEDEYSQSVIDLCIDIFCRNPKLGVSVKTVNEAAGYPLISNFIPMLAYDINKAPSFQYTNDVYIEDKLDGVRMVAHVTSEKLFNNIRGYSVSLKTRNGKSILGFNEIEEEIIDLCQKNGITSIVLDGELESDEDYTATMENLFTHKNNKKGTYTVFDVISSPAIEMGKTLQVARKNYLNRIFSDFKSDTLRLIKSQHIYTYAEDPKMGVILREALMDAEDRGVEGKMLRLNKPYVQDRTNSLLKIKSMESGDFRIIQILEGDGRLRGTAGSIIISANKTKVGSGFDDNTRNDMWKNPSKYIGKMCEVQYQEEISKTGKLRFPVFVRMRPDKD